MKSMDALHDIIAVSNWGKERLEIIENDLQVLEILKKCTSVRLKIQNWAEDESALTYKKEREQIKRWLQND